MPVFQGWIDTFGRRNRLSFFFATLSIGILIWGAQTFFPWLVGKVDNLDSSISDDIVYVLHFLAKMVYFLLSVANVFVASQRFRDFGWSGWCALVLLSLYYIPFFYVATYGGDLLYRDIAFVTALLILLLIPGSKEENKYGPNPLEKSSAMNMDQVQSTAKFMLASLFVRISGATYLICGLVGTYLSFRAIFDDFGVVVAILSLVFFPVLFLFAPWYVVFVESDWSLVVISYVIPLLSLIISGIAGNILQKPNFPD